MIDFRGTLLASTAWRIQNLYTIKTVKGKLEAFAPNEAQKAYYNNQWYCNHILKARQLGFSTLINIDNLDAMLFTKDLTCGIVDNTMPGAKKKLVMIRTAYDNLDNPEIHPNTWKIGRMIKEAVRMDAKAEEIKFSNGSSIYCGTSLRGDTVQRLHISELGKTAAFSPKKAEEIKDGALNTVHVGQVINIESTHEGGRFGLHYDMLKSAMEMVGQPLTEIDFKFHFYSWYLLPGYSLPQKMTLRPKTVEYFEKLKNETGLVLPHEKMLWYDRKSIKQGFGMKKEFPTTASEALDARVDGSIYGTIFDVLRGQDRINCRFEFDPVRPFAVSFDIGMSDSMSMWGFQETRTEHRVIDHFQASNQQVGFYIAKLREWERLYGIIGVVFLPHDAVKRDWEMVGFDDKIRAAGYRVIVVPRTPDIWAGINETFEFLRDCIFHERCAEPVKISEDEEYMSGINALENYRKAPPGINGVVKEMPLHDACSHSSDAFRTYAEAFSLGLVPMDVCNNTRRKHSRAMGVFGAD